MPYNEGWRKIPNTFGHNGLNGTVLKLMVANEHKTAEMADVGLQSVPHYTKEVGSLIGSYCTTI